MPAKTNATAAKSARRRNHSIDPALKARIGATSAACSPWPVYCWRCTRCRSASD